MYTRKSYLFQQLMVADSRGIQWRLIDNLITILYELYMWIA